MDSCTRAHRPTICRTLGIDDQVNVYGTFGQGQIFRYEPRSNRLEDLNVFIPIRQKGISLGRDDDKLETAWRVVVWDHATRKSYGVDESATILFSFDLSDGSEGAVERLGELSTPEFHGKRDVPYATLSLTLGQNRKLYYAAGREFDYGGSEVAAASHLLTYDLNSPGDET